MRRVVSSILHHIIIFRNHLCTKLRVRDMKKTHKMVLRGSRNSSNEHKKQIVCTKSASGLDRDHLQIIENEAHQHQASASDRALITIDDLPFGVVPKRARSNRDRRAPRLEPAPPSPLNQWLVPVNGLPDELLPHRKRELARRKIYSCNICGKSFEKYQALGGHKAHHSKASKKAKPLAVKGGSLRTNANNLAIVVHGQSHKCELCGREFAKAQALAGHKEHCKYRVLRICS